MDLEALEAERQAKKAKKLLPPKTKPELLRGAQASTGEEGTLVVNMDYV